MLLYKYSLKACVAPFASCLFPISIAPFWPAIAIYPFSWTLVISIVGNASRLPVLLISISTEPSELLVIVPNEPPEFEAFRIFVSTDSDTPLGTKNVIEPTAW